MFLNWQIFLQIDVLAEKQLVLLWWWWLVRIDYFMEFHWWKIMTNEKFWEKKNLFKISKKLLIKIWNISFIVLEIFNCLVDKIWIWWISFSSVKSSRDDNHYTSFSLSNRFFRSHTRLFFIIEKYSYVSLDELFISLMYIFPVYLCQ
jgi:hypothetical protein